MDAELEKILGPRFAHGNDLTGGVDARAWARLRRGLRPLDTQASGLRFSLRSIGLWSTCGPRNSDRLIGIGCPRRTRPLRVPIRRDLVEPPPAPFGRLAAPPRAVIRGAFTANSGGDVLALRPASSGPILSWWVCKTMTRW